MALTIALAGNPNSGKTTLFNALTGSNQFVGNWPGVTVERKEGKLKGHKDVTVMDLPGVYSLSPYTLEEVVTRNYLVDEHPDVILNIIDGTNLERNLYLTTQLTELGILFTQRQLIPAHCDLHGVSERCHLAHRNRYALDHAHVHDPAFDRARAGNLHHRHRLPRLDCSQRLHISPLAVISARL
jgi:GTPase Era involved in 16S rRNA processing